MYRVCARYEGTSIFLEEFETIEEAKEFMAHDYIIAYADELENEDGNEVVHPYEMYIDDEEEIPFNEPVFYDWDDDLPF